MLDRRAADERAGVENVAWVVVERDRPGAHEQLAAFVPDRHAVDRQLVEEAAAEVSEVEVSLDRARDEGLGERPHVLAPAVRTRDEQHRGHREEPEEDQDASRHEGDETAALHA